MNKTPRLDAMRAMREAKYERDQKATAAANKAERKAKAAAKKTPTIDPLMLKAGTFA